jgi:hypothetical protein
MLHTLSNEALFERVFTKFFRDNPQCKRGERMQEPVCLARNGVLLHDYHEDQLNGDSVIIQAQSFKHFYDEDGTLPTLEISHRGWVYPYCVSICGLSEVLNAKIGDDVTIINPRTFEDEVVRVTAELQRQHRAFVIRLALGGTYKSAEPDSFI